MKKQTIGHTPGPWILVYRAFQDGSGGTSQFSVETGGGSGGRKIAMVGHWGTFEDEANAHLIAAAPELLEQCHRLLNILDCPGNLRKTYKHCIDTSKAVIAKAEGRS